MTFAVRVLKLVDALPKSAAGRTIANQLARSGTSVASNYRAALRAKSEADESEFWIDLTQRCEMLTQKRLQALRDEAEELTKIFNVTRTTTKRRTKNAGPNRES